MHTYKYIHTCHENIHIHIIHVHVHINAFMYAYMYAFIRACTYKCLCLSCVSNLRCAPVRECACECVCVHACMLCARHVRAQARTHTHTHTHTPHAHTHTHTIHLPYLSFRKSFKVIRGTRLTHTLSILHINI